MNHDKITVYFDYIAPNKKWLKIDRHLVQNLPSMYSAYNFEWVNDNQIIAKKKIGLPYHVENDIYSDLGFEHLRRN